MTRKLHYFEEPKLQFAYEQTTEDCRDGLTLFGPYSQAKGSIKVGVVGSKYGLSCYSSFVRRINQPIFSTSLGRPFYPGFSSVFGIEWPESPSAHLNINPENINSLVEEKNIKVRTYKLVSVYLESILKYIKNEESPIDLWYIVIPYPVWLKCRPKSVSKAPDFSKREIKDRQAGMLSLFGNKALDDYLKMAEFDSDFHDQLKARALFEKIQSPIQIVLESTLLLKTKDGSKSYTEEMQAHLAWTQSSAIYYKLGNLRWKLGAVRKGVCYVGLVFKKLQEGLAHKGYACSAAQMFLDSGDGVVFRGNIGPWMSKNEKTYHLDHKSAKNLLSIALESYRDSHGEYPSELFIHGKASFNDDEWSGFNDAIAISPKTKLVGVVITETDGFRLFKNSENSENNYGVMRGTALIAHDSLGYLWTRGYIPKTKTSNHLEIAKPLKISITRGNCDISTVIRDILALTKLNYNACIYGDGLPVTLRFSDNIGNILTALPEVNWAAKPFKYYI